MNRLSPIHWVYLLAHLVLVIGGVALQPLQGFWATFGQGVLAAGVAGYVVFAYVLMHDELADRVRVVSEFGILKIFASRGAQIRNEYEELLGDFNELDVLGFGLNSLREDYKDSFVDWAKRARVRILLLDPDFPTPETSLAAIRDAEEGKASDAIAAEVKRFVEDAAPAVARPDGRFAIRLYRCIPSINLFRVDDRLFWGPYLIRQPSRNLPTFLVAKPGTLYEKCRDHFNDIWDSDDLSGPVPAEWLEDRT